MRSKDRAEAEAYLEETVGLYESIREYVPGTRARCVEVWVMVAPRLHYLIPISSNGLTYGSSGRIMIRRKDSGVRRNTLAHELTHLLLGKQWELSELMEEGLCVHVEQVLVPEDRFRGLYWLLYAGRGIGVDLLTYHWDWAIGPANRSRTITRGVREHLGTYDSVGSIRDIGRALRRSAWGERSIAEYGLGLLVVDDLIRRTGGITRFYEALGTSRARMDQELTRYTHETVVQLLKQELNANAITAWIDAAPPPVVKRVTESLVRCLQRGDDTRAVPPLDGAEVRAALSEARAHLLSHSGDRFFLHESDGFLAAVEREWNRRRLQVNAALKAIRR